jgi:hypothetical protein
VVLLPLVVVMRVPLPLAAVMLVPTLAAWQRHCAAAAVCGLPALLAHARPRGHGAAAAGVCALCASRVLCVCVRCSSSATAKHLVGREGLKVMFAPQSRLRHT